MPATISDTLLMIRPANFGFNPETADSNIYQQQDIRPIQEIHDLAKKEFDAFVETLNKHGVSVIAVDDQVEPVTTDAVFPNNWFSTHDDGRLILYPMASPMRRLERRKDIIEIFSAADRKVEEIIDLTFFEEEGQYLEGTGSLVLDRGNKIMYACISERTHPRPLQYLSEILGYELVSFQAAQKAGGKLISIYHTNVMMHVGEHLAVACLDCVTSPKEALRLKDKLQDVGKVILPITVQQKFAFAGNMLEVQNGGGERFTIMSTTAFESLKSGQKQLLEKYTQLLPMSIPTIEKLGGGSARCMMAEVFLPRIAKERASTVL